MIDSNKKVAILLKSNLKYDGRVLAEIDTLSLRYPNCNFRIILLPDGDDDYPKFRKNVSVQSISVPFRKLKFKRLLLPLTTIYYTLLCYLKLLKYRPDILHIHDIFPVPSGLVYHFIHRPKLIYDDHELFKLDANIFQKVLYWTEGKILKRADAILVANQYRSRILRFIYKISPEKIRVLENFNHEIQKENIYEESQRFEDLVRSIHSKGQLVILHQGQVSQGRGLDYLLRFAENSGSRIQIIFMGISQERYSQLINDYSFLEELSIHIGYVPYEHINEYWSRVDGALVFYDTAEINNKYCAPNRLYLALSNRIPLVVNDENPVLNEAVNRLNAGVAISKDSAEMHIEKFFENIENKMYYQGQRLPFTFMEFSAPILLNVYNEYV